MSWSSVLSVVRSASAISSAGSSVVPDAVPPARVGAVRMRRRSPEESASPPPPREGSYSDG
ncbi:hypothetical protein A7K94_0209575 [Modestobacter sp. VKM Ac-2676]|nr:hypothetical protein A7K94_0209575 [Modestobacter sp. VKM Ac-2676]